MPALHPNLDLVVIPDPRRLLEQAADGFLTPRQGSAEEPFPSPGYLLALRQGGLRDELLSLAAARGIPGWGEPPIAVFHELHRCIGRCQVVLGVGYVATVDDARIRGDLPGYLT